MFCKNCIYKRQVLDLHTISKFGVAEFGYEFVSRRGATALRSQCVGRLCRLEASGVGVPPVVASGVRRVAESKALRCLIFKFHTSIQQRRKFYAFYLLDNGESLINQEI
jgi:hypothetical protein